MGVNNRWAAERPRTPVTTCVGAVIVANNRVLLGRRTVLRTTYPDCWDIFGGHVEGVETLEEALQRETMEELGVTITAWQPLGVVHDPAEPAEIHLFLVRDWNGTPRNLAPHEHSEIGWFRPEDLSDLHGLREYRQVVVQAVERAT